jgi:hypothetical protein
MLLDTFHGDVNARTTVGMILMLARTAFEPLFIPVRSLCVSTHWIVLTREFRINPGRGHALEGGFVRRVVLKRTERKAV